MSIRTFYFLTVLRSLAHSYLDIKRKSHIFRSGYLVFLNFQKYFIYVEPVYVERFNRLDSILVVNRNNFYFKKYILFSSFSVNVILCKKTCKICASSFQRSDARSFAGRTHSPGGGKSGGKSGNCIST